MNAIELLKNDHEKISGILEKLDQTTERALKTREEQFARLKEELEAHSHIEETVFYPALSDDSRTHTLALEALEEHRVVKTLLDEIATLAVDTEEWTAKFKVLKISVDQHVKQEEGEIFKQARQVLNKARLDELGEEMEEARGQEPRSTVSARGSSNSYASPRSGSGASKGARGGASRGFSFGISLMCPSFFNRCR
jgi:hemerythrin-like domain-containing protein